MILFVCSQGRLRSRTAELLCIFGGLTARSAGTDNDADVVLTDTMMRQASLVVCMEKKHREAVKEFSHYGAAPVVTLGIPDEFNRLEEMLVKTLVYQMSFHDEAVSMAMERGYQLLQSQPGYLKELGTHTTNSAGNPAFSIFPS